MNTGRVSLHRFGQAEPQVIPVEAPPETNNYGHGGGDYYLMRDFCVPCGRESADAFFGAGLAAGAPDLFCSRALTPLPHRGGIVKTRPGAKKTIKRKEFTCLRQTLQSARFPRRSAPACWPALWGRARRCGRHTAQPLQKAGWNLVLSEEFSDPVLNPMLFSDLVSAPLDHPGAEPGALRCDRRHSFPQD